jgi:hypothetical protein
MRTGKRQGARRKFAGDFVGRGQRGEVGWMQADCEPIGNEARSTVGAALRFHGAFDPPEDLHRLQSGPEEACAGAFDEALEEALDA